MRPLRSGLWLEYATTAGVVPAAGTTLRLLPMESVLTASWERLSGYNAAAVSPDSHCCGVRETPLAAVITNNPTYRENFHTPRNALPRGRVLRQISCCQVKQVWKILIQRSRSEARPYILLLIYFILLFRPSISPLLIEYFMAFLMGEMSRWTLFTKLTTSP